MFYLWGRENEQELVTWSDTWLVIRTHSWKEKIGQLYVFFLHGIGPLSLYKVTKVAAL